jgi:hypothetical protein
MFFHIDSRETSCFWWCITHTVGARPQQPCHHKMKSQRRRLQAGKNKTSGRLSSTACGWLFPSIWPDLLPALLRAPTRRHAHMTRGYRIVGTLLDLQSGRGGEVALGGVLTSKFRRKRRLRVFTFGVSVWSLVSSRSHVSASAQHVLRYALLKL